MEFTIKKELEEYFGKPLDQVKIGIRPLQVEFDGKSMHEIVYEFLPLNHNFSPDKNVAIYHYTSQEGLKGILSSGTLWFTDSKFLNDSSEGQYIYSLLRNILDEYGDDVDEDFKKFRKTVCTRILDIDEYHYYIPNTRKSYIKEIYKCPQFFICSFSRNQDSLSMWNYYTKSENSIGANIQFEALNFSQHIDKYKEKAEIGLDEIVLCNVLYDVNVQTEFLHRATEIFYMLWTISKRHENVIEYFAIMLYSFKFVFKHPAFKDEQEIRLILETFDDANINLRYKEMLVRSSKDGFIPYLEIPFDKTDVKQITASPNMKNYETIHYLLKKLGYSDNIKVTRSTIPWRS